jgi:ubiquitin-protein ligase
MNNIIYEEIDDLVFNGMKDFMIDGDKSTDKIIYGKLILGEKKLLGIRIELPSSYPNSQPKIFLDQRVFAPHIYTSLQYCIKLTKNSSGRFTLKKTISDLIYHLYNPSNGDLNREAYELYCKDQDEYRKKLLNSIK